ncbi:hypothetical protein B0I00_0679 [Novosphingobium kunmingense]|uniref:Uncharacterized protein n=1 Tax=Novosphingobium kunmingense TaxID=1211806 RepID=A0A2N0I2P1_9SPHN|nr:hypothetical protein [Novosphingobium kunmingense]PKB25478.1 hypothetical protein B0I00_0679 [Novosphingobium kunmingense]
MTTEIVFALIGGLLVLALNWRAMASHGLPRERLVKLALIWIGIIIVITAGVRFFAT